MAFFQFTRLQNSFRYAFRGLGYAFRHEQSFRIHILAALGVVLLMLVFRVTFREAIILWLVIAAVLVLELINTIFEYMVDMLQPRIHHLAQIIKDMMAATVFLASLGALVIGILIFWPYIFR